MLAKHLNNARFLELRLLCLFVLACPQHWEADVFVLPTQEIDYFSIDLTPGKTYLF